MVFFNLSSYAETLHRMGTEARNKPAGICLQIRYIRERFRGIR